MSYICVQLRCISREAVLGLPTRDSYELLFSVALDRIIHRTVMTARGLCPARFCATLREHTQREFTQKGGSPMDVLRFKQANCKNCYKCVRFCPSGRVLRRACNRYSPHSMPIATVPRPNQDSDRAGRIPMKFLSYGHVLSSLRRTCRGNDHRETAEREIRT